MRRSYARLLRVRALLDDVFEDIVRETAKPPAPEEGCVPGVVISDLAKP
jgi:hypothetical protein